MENKFLKLTNTVYKVLEFFPESDPLKHRAKDKALSIMEHLVLINETSGWASFQKEKIKVHLLEDIDILLGYLWIGKTQGWLNSVNCLIIANEYEKIKKELEPVIELTQKLPEIDKPFGTAQGKPTGKIQEPQQVSPSPIKEEVLESFNISDRQKKILEFISTNGKAQVVNLQTVLPDITKRTIRRDLDELLGAGKIIRQGDFNQVVYKIKG
jgi:hypothetical protein